jgi:CubicO group peptidase (beta-lactamase class C family)
MGIRKPRRHVVRLYADEACPPEWMIDEASAVSANASSGSSTWFPPFDLASLTKPILANAFLRRALDSDPQKLAACALADLIQPQNEVGDLLVAWARERPSMTLADLLNHTSGLPPWGWFGRMLWEFEKSSKNQGTTRRRRSVGGDTQENAAPRALEDLTRHILSLAPSEPTGETKYSDLNYFLLARVIENLSDSKISGWSERLSALNAHWDSRFWHASLEPEKSASAIPFFPYLHSQVVAHIYESRKLDHHAGDFGSVHDTNANILASEFKFSSSTYPLISSHAGLFGNIFDVRKTVPFFVETQARLRSLPTSNRQQNARFQWGFDTPSGALSAAGINHWPLRKEQSIFGHLGYTGTSLWMAEDGQFHILLTNRTAARRTVGAQNMPRILLFQADAGTTPECKVKHVRLAGQTAPVATETWQALATSDAYALCLEQFRLGTRYWDRHSLRTPPDLSKVRRSIGQHLWSH